MSGLRFIDIESKSFEVLDLTSLVVEEFRALVEFFEEMFQAHVAQWRLDGKPRTSRSYTTYSNCPLPTPEDRLLFVLVYLKNNPLQTMHGRLFGMPQCKANVWLHILLPVLQRTLADLGLAPSRSLTDLARKLNVTIEQASQILDSSSQQPAPALPQEAQESSQQTTPPEGSPPLFVMMVPSEASRDPKTRVIRSSITAARKRSIPSKTCS